MSEVPQTVEEALRMDERLRLHRFEEACRFTDEHIARVRTFLDSIGLRLLPSDPMLDGDPKYVNLSEEVKTKIREFNRVEWEREVADNKKYLRLLGYE